MIENANQQETEPLPLKPDQETKAELTLIAKTFRKTRQERQAFCKSLGVPWAEYQRLCRKWSKVTERWTRWNEAKGGDICTMIKP